MLQSGELGPVARRQLTAWAVIASTWDVRDEADEDTGQVVARCGQCSRGIYLVTDPRGARFTYTDDQRLALVVLHLRSHHPTLDPNR